MLPDLSTLGINCSAPNQFSMNLNISRVDGHDPEDKEVMITTHNFQALAVHDALSESEHCSMNFQAFKPALFMVEKVLRS